MKLSADTATTSIEHDGVTTIIEIVADGVYISVIRENDIEPVEVVSWNETEYVDCPDDVPSIINAVIHAIKHGGISLAKTIKHPQFID